MKKKKQKKTKKIKKENPVYVRIDYEGAIDSQKDILSYQMGLINILKSLKKYHSLREKEENLKMDLRNMLKTTKENIKKMEENFPEVKGPKSKQEDSQKKEPTIEYYNQDLESQLEQIKKKLQEIGR